MHKRLIKIQKYANNNSHWKYKQWMKSKKKKMFLKDRGDCSFGIVLAVYA